MEVLRGDIWFIENVVGCGTCGVEQRQGRPAVIVSNNTGNHFSMSLEVVYLTTRKKKPLPTHVPIKTDHPSTALCEQISTIDKRRLGSFYGRVTPEEMQKIDWALMVSLGL